MSDQNTTVFNDENEKDTDFSGFSDDLDLNESDEKNESEESILKVNESEEDSSTPTDSKKDNEKIVLSKSRIILIKKLLDNAKENNQKVIELLSVFSTDEEESALISQISDDSFSKSGLSEDTEEGNIVEGVFDGENMIGPDGKQYSIPANYASKSKLVEGDILKLTIASNGAFIYKQIGPIERKRVVGLLEKSSTGQFVVSNEDGKWKILTASVTYFKGSLGDEVIILVPKEADSQWAAVDNIVRKII